MKYLAVLTLLGLFILSCEVREDNLDTTYEEGVSFTLAYNESATCSCEGPEVRFVRVVTESRCPVLVECIWAGEVIVEMEVNGELVELGLSPIDTAPDQATFGNWTVTLQAVNPYPDEALLEMEELDQEIYSVDLVVESI